MILLKIMLPINIFNYYNKNKIIKNQFFSLISAILFMLNKVLVVQGDTFLCIVWKNLFFL